MRFKINFIIFSSFLILLISFVFPPHIFADLNWYKFTDNPVLEKGSPGQWDEQFVFAGDVIKNGTSFKMWYTGVNHLGIQQIGLAESSDGITWNKNSNNPVLKIGLSDEWDNITASQATVLFDGNKYFMWYSGINSPVYNENWNIGLATSYDGINWTKYVNNPVFLHNSSGWENRAVYQPKVLKIDNNYLMWYSATSNNPSGPRWQIGMAQSGDGIHWTKYQGNPVLKADQNWEFYGGDGLGSPSVIYDGTKFQMWYHVSGIGYAESPDGINWTKNPLNPVVPRGFSDWDDFFLTDPNVIKDGNDYKMWYSGWMDYSNVSVGLASTAPIVTNTPTPTPTPTIPDKKPIIIVPGFGASFSFNDFTSCKISESHTWKPIQKFKQLYYDPLLNSLTKSGLKENDDFYFYSYDWRQKPETLALNFKNYIDNISVKYPTGTKFYLIGHSLGGLLLRSYAQLYPDNNKAFKILTAGTPHLGSLLSYPVWENGELQIINDKLIKTILNFVIVRCQPYLAGTNNESDFTEVKIDETNQLGLTRRQVIQNMVPIIKSLLPVFNYLKTPDGILGYLTMNLKNDFLINHPIKNPPDFPLTDTITGKNNKTLEYFNIIDPSKNDLKKGNWIDGKIASEEYTDAGDDTVLAFSSRVEGANNFGIDGDHQETISSSQAISHIFDFLGITNNQVNTNDLNEKLADKDLLVITSDNQLNFKITDPDNQTQDSQDNFIILIKPVTGKYKFTISDSTDKETKIYLMQVKKNEEVKNKIYKIKLNKNQDSNFTLEYSDSAVDPVTLKPQ